MMRVYAVSDLHGHFPHITSCELLLLGGDYAPLQLDDDHKKQRAWFDEEFRKWLLEIPAKYKVGIAGNHDFALRDKDFAKSLPWKYLEDELLDLEGVKIWGTPWTPRCGLWAFMLDERELKHKFDPIPKGLDILLSHAPAYRFLDKTDSGAHAGSYSLREKLMEVKPDTMVHGHIHEGRGLTHVDRTRIQNVAYCNSRMQPTFNPMVVQLVAGGRE